MGLDSEEWSMKATSEASTITVTPAGGASLIQAAAASMTPNSWKEVTGIIGQKETLQQPNVATSVLAQANTFGWNPVLKRIQGLGQGHGGGLAYWEYDDATNTFKRWWQSAPSNYSPPWPSSFGGGIHAYDHNVVNPYTGDYYVRDSSQGSSSLQIWKLPNGASRGPGGDPNTSGPWGDGSALVMVPSVRSQVPYQGAATGHCWAKTGFFGSGAQGCFVGYITGSYAGGDPATWGGVIAYDPVANSWIKNVAGAGQIPLENCYHGVCEYSPSADCIVYGGGNGQGDKLWKMTSNGIVSAVTTPPFGVGVSLDTSNSQFAPEGRLTVDPVTGKFLLFGKGQLWELDATTNTWARL